MPRCPRRTDGRFDAQGEDYAGGKTATFTYDSLDREQSMAVTAPDEPDRRTSTDWWDSGARKQRITNRSDTSKNTIEREFFFADGRMSRMDRKRSGADSFAKDQSYTYDANGNRTGDERGSHVFNARDQLTKWTKKNQATTSYTLNGSGAILSETTGSQPTTTFHYGPGDERLLSAQSGGTTTTYRYDEGLGEITGYSAAGESGTTFSYDQFGRKKLDKSGDDPATTYSYDGLDRRDTKTQGGKTFDFSYVGSSESLSQEQQFGGGEVRSYDYDASMDREGMARRGTASGGAAKYRAYSKDANGSVEGLENDQGEIPADERYGYDPYGKAQGPEGSDPNATDPKPAEVEQGLSDDAKANPFRFEGHYADTSTQTYDMQARPYLPEVGRFLTEDRYESAAGDLNLETDTLTQDRYAFAGGNPVNNIEFDGHEPIGSYNPNGCQSKSCSGRSKKANQPPTRMPTTSGDYTTQPRSQMAKPSRPRGVRVVDSVEPPKPTAPPKAPLSADAARGPASPSGSSCGPRANVAGCGGVVGPQDQLQREGLTRRRVSGAEAFFLETAIGLAISPEATTAKVGTEAAAKGAPRLLRFIRGVGRGGNATEEAPAIVRGGESAAARYGREIHKTFDYGPGFEREVRLPSGRRADAVNFEAREIVELKPNNPRAIAGGRRQLGGYADELNREFPGRPFTTRVQTYERP